MDKIKKAVIDREVDVLIKLCETNQQDMVDYRDNGERMIHIAVRLGSVDLLQRLHQIGSNMTLFTESEYSISVSILHMACEQGNIPMVKFILQNIPELKSQNASRRNYRSNVSYRNAFYFAGKSGCEEVVRCLQSEGKLDINEHMPDGDTAVKLMIYEHDSNGVSVLCKCGANFKSLRFNRGLTVVQYLAERSGSSATIKALLDYGADVNEIWTNSSRRKCLHQSPLFMALKHSFTKNAETMLEYGANIHFAGQTQNSKSGPIGCFQLAIKRCPDLIPAFLQRGANPNETVNGQPLLSYAMENHLGDTVIVALVQAGADVNRKWKGKSIIENCSSFSELKPFIDAGITVQDIEQKFKIPILSLVVQSYSGNESDTISDLISKGANPNLQPEETDSALILAVKSRIPDVQVIRALIDGGANLNHVGCDGDMAIHVCCRKVVEGSTIYLTILEELINETSSSMPNRSGDCPLDILAKALKSITQYKTELFRLYNIQNNPNETIEKAIMILLEKGADPNAHGRGRNSPLIYAIRSEVPSLVQAFIDGGADILVDGENHESALDLSLKSVKQIRNVVVKSVVYKGFVPKLKSKTKKINFIQILLDDQYEDSFIKEALTQGLDPNDVVPGTDSPLIAAVKAERYQIVLYLLDAGAYVSYLNRKMLNAFDIFEDICIHKKMTHVNAYNRRRPDEPMEEEYEELERIKRQRVLKSFLSHGIQVNQSSRSGMFPLHIAVALHDEDAVKSIVKNGEVDAVSKNFGTPLMIAAAKGLTKVVELLLSEKADPNFNIFDVKGERNDDTTGGTILTRMLQTSTCSEDTLLDITKLLLQHGCDPNLEPIGTDSPLMCAVRRNFQELTRTLLDAKAKVNHTGKDNLTALHVYFKSTSFLELPALKKIKTGGCYYEILKMLLDFGASTEMLSDHNELPLHFALSFDSQHLETEVLYLLNYSRDCNIMSEYGSYPLLLATDRGYFRVTKKLIAMGVDVKCEDKQKRTILHSLMYHQNLKKEIILQCTAKGANINAFNMDGYTPLVAYIMHIKQLMDHMYEPNSSNRTFVEDLRFLLENGADPDVCTTNGNSALMIAVELKIPEFILILINAKAKVNHINKNGTTALHMCLEIDDGSLLDVLNELLLPEENFEIGRKEQRDIHKEIVCSLLQAGADVNIVDDKGKSPIYTLISINEEERCNQLLPLLLTKNANVNCGDEVPLIVAAKKLNCITIDTLLKAGANVNITDKHGDTALTAVLCQIKTHTSEFGTILQITSFHTIVDVLLKAGAKPNPYKSGIDKHSPLITAIQSRLPSVVKKLLMFGADPNHIGKDNLTALQSFILQLDDYRRMHEIHHGQYRRTYEMQHDIYRRKHKLHYELYQEILNSLLEYKVDINLTYTHDFPVLMAIERGQYDTVKSLITAFPDAVDDGGYTQEALQKCLTLDILTGTGMIDMLLEIWGHKQDLIQEKFVNDYLMWLTSNTVQQSDIIEKVTVALLSKLTIKIVNFQKNNDSPLIYFTKYGSAKIVGMLLGRNQDVNHVGRMGLTALHYIIDGHCDDDSKDVFDLLWEHKPNLFIKDEMGKTPIDVIFETYNKKNARAETSRMVLSFIERNGLPVSTTITETFKRSSRRGDFKVMSALLPHVPDVNQVDRYSGDTVLHTCWNDGPLAVDEVIQFLSLLKKAGGNLTMKNKSGTPPLISLLKVKIPDEDIVKVVQWFESEGAIETSDKDESFLLHLAVQRGLPLTVGFLLCLGQSQMKTNSANKTYLHVALKNQNINSVQIVDQLIEHCDKTKLNDVLGDDVLVLAINNADTSVKENRSLRSDLVSLLLKNGADPNKHNSNNIPLHCAARYCDVSTMECLVKGGANINAINDDGQNALHNVFYDKKPRGNTILAITFLLLNGIDVNLQDAYGSTPLMKAVNESEDAVKLLLDNNANVLLVDSRQQSVLDLFCLSGEHLGIGKLLVNAGASPKNCLHSAISNYSLKQQEDFESFLLMLLDKRADPNTLTSMYSKPCLIQVVEMGMTNVVQRMCQCGVDVNAKYYSRSALHHACELEKDKKRDELVKLLIEHGASLDEESTDVMDPLDVYVTSLIRDLSSYKDDDLTTKDTHSVVNIDLSLFNIMVQGGRDLNEAASTVPYNRFGFGLRNTDTTLLRLIKSGFFMAAENLLKCGLNLQHEKWLESYFDLDSFGVSKIRISSQGLERYDVKEWDIKLSNALTYQSVRLPDLSCHCRSVIRKALRTASKGAEILSKIDELPVPKRIKSFLRLDDGIHVSEIMMVQTPPRLQERRNRVLRNIRAHYVTDIDDNRAYRSWDAVKDDDYDYYDYDSALSSDGYDIDDD